MFNKGKVKILNIFFIIRIFKVKYKNFILRPVKSIFTGLNMIKKSFEIYSSKMSIFSMTSPARMASITSSPS
jgi:hypothetical protein